MNKKSCLIIVLSFLVFSLSVVLSCQNLLAKGELLDEDTYLLNGANTGVCTVTFFPVFQSEVSERRFQANPE